MDNKWLMRDVNRIPLFHTSPKTLLELAAIKFASHLWIEQFNEFYSPEYRGRSVTQILDFRCDIKATIEVPPTIEDMIESRFRPMARELNGWFWTMKNSLNGLQVEDMYRRLNLVAFGGDGCVDYYTTAMNFLHDDGLSDMNRFEIACVFCIQEEIEALWPSVQDIRFMAVELVEGWENSFEVNFTLFYWIFRLRNDLNQLPLRGFDRIEELMFRMCCKNSFPSAFEHFVKFLDLEVLTVYADRFFPVDAITPKTMECLRYFDGHLQRRILTAKHIDVVAYLAGNFKPVEYVVQAWNYVKNFIVEIDNRYVVLIKRLIDIRNRGHSLGTFEYSYVETLLLEIWSNTPDNLKLPLVNLPARLNSISQALCEFKICDLMKGFGRDIRFLLAILDRTEIPVKTRFFNSYWPKWIVGVSPNQLEQLMKVCLVNTNMIDQFKKTFLSSQDFREYCSTLISRRYLDEFNELMNFFYPDAEKLLNIKTYYLLTNEYWMQSVFKPFDIQVPHQFAELIADILQDDDQTKKFKNQFILSRASIDTLYDKLNRNNFHYVKILVDSFLSSEIHLVKFKSNFLEIFRNKIILGEFREFEETDWGSFLKWCLNDDQQQARNFLKNLPIEDIFETAFRNCVECEGSTLLYRGARVLNKCNFDELDKFLEWYFDSYREFENFKAGMVEHYGGIEAIKVKFGIENEHIFDLVRKYYYLVPGDKGTDDIA